MKKVFLTITPNSPLEQFAIPPLIPMNIGNFSFSFTNPSLSMLLTISLVLLLVHLVTVLVHFFCGKEETPYSWRGKEFAPHELHGEKRPPEKEGEKDKEPDELREAIRKCIQRFLPAYCSNFFCRGTGRPILYEKSDD
jgi:hypothetical protein